MIAPLIFFTLSAGLSSSNAYHTPNDFSRVRNSRGVISSLDPKLISTNRLNPNRPLTPLRNDICSIEDFTSDEKKPLWKEIAINTGTTLIASTALSVAIPPIKRFGLTQTFSLGSPMLKSFKSVAPIVTYTVFAPSLLKKLFQSSSILSSMPKLVELFILSVAKHFWIFDHEKNLNAMSTGLTLTKNPNIQQVALQRLSHTFRESILIFSVGKQTCDTRLDKLKSYLILAALQTGFDRGAFPTSVSVPCTFIYRLLYLVSVTEIIQSSRQFVERFARKIPNQPILALEKNLAESEPPNVKEIEPDLPLESIDSNSISQ